MAFGTNATSVVIVYCYRNVSLLIFIDSLKDLAPFTDGFGKGVDRSVQLIRSSWRQGWCVSWSGRDGPWETAPCGRQTAACSRI